MFDIPGRALCQELLGQFDEGMDQLRSAKTNLIGDLTGKITELQNTIYSPLNDLQNSVSEALDNMESMVPDFSAAGAAIQEITDILQACSVLDEKYEGNPANALQNLTDSLFDGANDIMDSIFGAVPELDLARGLNDLLNRGADFDLENLIPGMDSMLNCLSSVCGSDVSSRIDQMNDIMGELNLTDSGSFDLEGIMDSAGLGADAKEGLTNVTSTVTTVKANITQSVTDGISSVKSAQAAISGRFSLL